MLSGLQAVLIILILLLIITQTVSVRIRYDKRFIFDFNLTLVSFTIIPDGKSRRSKSKDKKASVISILKAVDYALERSHLEIAAIPQIMPDREHPLTYGYVEILKYIILSHFDRKTRSLGYSKAERTDYPFDITFKISFYHLVCTLILYLKECHKSRQKARARI